MDEESALRAKSAKKEEKIKEEILDESFKKAEVSRGLRPPKSKPPIKKSHEKFFPKLGILLIIIAIIGLLFIFTVPWAYVKYDTGDGTIETLFYKDFKDGGSEYQQIVDLFKSPNSSYIGVSIDDFTDVPVSASYGFILLIVLGVALTIFGILDKIYDFSIEMFTIIHFIFGMVTIVPGTFIVLSVIKVLGSHFLVYYNMPLIPNQNIVLVFPGVFIVIILGFMIIKLAFTVMRMDFKELEKTTETEISEQPFSYDPYGGKL